MNWKRSLVERPVGLRASRPRLARRLSSARRLFSAHFEPLEHRQLLAADVIVSEIMYHPASENSAEEYIELYNRGNAAVDLNGWTFADGVNFIFPGYVLEPNSYVVIAANRAAFGALYPTVSNVLGGWTGELSNSGEKIELRNAVGVEIDRVRYADEGDWALRTRGPFDNGHQGWEWFAAHDGGGRSLELVNLSLNNDYGQNWASSNANGGTPGAANSVAVASPAPVIANAEHSPAVPKSTDNVTVAVDIVNQGGGGLTASVAYRVDGAPTFSTAPLFDDGLHGDGAAGDGRYGATLPPQANGTVIEFYVSAAHNGGSSRTYPAPTFGDELQAANFLYQVDDATYSGNQPIYRFVMTAAERAELQQISDINTNSNAQLNVTLVSSDGVGTQVRYNAGLRLRGASSRTFAVKSYRLSIPSDRPWNDVTSVNFNARQIWSQIAGAAVFKLAGLPAADVRPVQLRVNGIDLSAGSGYAQQETFDGDFVNDKFPYDADGNLYRKVRPDNKWAFRNGNITQYLNDGWSKHTNSGANDWSDLNEFLRVINQASVANYVSEVSAVIDLDQWLRWFAVMALLDSNETNVSNGADDDYALYFGADHRGVILPHDLDSVFGAQGSIPTAGIFRALTDNGTLPQLERFFGNAEIVTRYYQQLRELIETVFSPSQLNPLLDNLLGGNLPQASIDAMKQFAVARNAYVLSVIPTAVTINSTAPTVNGYRQVTTPTVALGGLAPVESTHKVLVNGQEVPYTPRTGQWTTGAVTGISETIVAPQSTWRYHDLGQDLGVAWRAAAYDDSSWAQGPAHLGFGDGDEATVVNCGPSFPACDSANTPTFYFRHTFTVADRTKYTGLLVRLVRDDGAAVYLNGVEIVRDRLQPGATFSSLATGLDPNATENNFYEFVVPTAALANGTNVLAVEVHQNSLTSSDLSFDLALEGLLVQINNVTLVPTGSVWRYHDNGVNLGTGWIAPTYVDSDAAGWASGAAQLGYGDGDEATVISFGPSSGNKYPTYYFRRTFPVTNAGSFGNLRLRLMRDDGAAVYLNGVEIARSNLAVGATYNSFAQSVVGGGSESQFYEFNVDPNLLVEGNNVLAVEVHQSDASSSDVSFELELIGQQISGGQQAGVPVLPGVNRMLVQALDAQNNEVARSTLDIWYDDANVEPVSGAITANTTWTAAAGPYRVVGDITVAAGATLTIQPGTTVFFNPGTSLTINGGLLAEGTDTAHIRFARVPATAGSWGGLVLNGPANNRLVYVDMEHADMRAWIQATGTQLTIDHATFGPATHSILDAMDTSVLIRDSVLPTTASEPTVLLRSVPATSPMVLVGNTFQGGAVTGAALEIRGGARPDAIAQVLNNRFDGRQGHGLELRTADVHVEGNLFHDYRNATHSAAAISARFGGNAVLARNTFADNSTALLFTDGAFVTAANNTFVGHLRVVADFDDPSLADDPGVGGSFFGNIFWNNVEMFAHVYVDDPDNGTTQLSVDHSLVPAAFLGLGIGNRTGDPRLQPDNGLYKLLPGSMAMGGCPNGIDMGALVPSGATIGSEPSPTTVADSAMLTVGGAGITHYRYSLDGGAFGAETPVATPIALSGLTLGSHSVRVIGKNSAGVWQSESAATASRAWTVAAPAPRIRLNEILADNNTTVTIEGLTPDAIELVNAGLTAVDLGGMSLSDDPADPTRFVFPSGTVLEPGAFLVVYGGDGPSFAGLFIGFALDDAGETLYLYDNAGALHDSVAFGRQISDASLGRGSDDVWRLNVPTLGTANVARPLGDGSKVVVNEWLASADRLYKDDFVELYNPDSLPVDIGGMHLTDNLSAQPTKHTFAPHSFLAAGGLALYTLDDGNQPGPDRVNFRLSPRHELLALTDADGDLTSAVLVSSQRVDVSQGRGPNGATRIQSYTAPTPGENNANFVATTAGVLAYDHVWKYNDTDTNLGTVWREPTFNDAAWPSGAGLLHREDDPLPVPKNTRLAVARTHYFRTRFDASTVPASATHLELNLIIDDGAIVYLNGAEIVRLGMPAGPINHATLASRRVENAIAEGPFSIPVSLLLPGDNVLAVEVHQETETSTDMAFGMTVTAVTPPPDPSRNLYALLDGLRVTELSYAPNQGGSYSWIELQNVGPVPLDLTGVRFDIGIAYTFGARMLMPGERLVLVRDLARFRLLYGDSVPVEGVFEGNLNNNGEHVQLTLPAPLNGEILDFTYDDAWYPATDGGGRTLTIRDATASPDRWNVAEGWRPSYFAGGSPGTSDDNVVLINELLAHSTGAGDWVELVNTTGDPLDIGYWYLSDDAADLRKYQLPAGTLLAGNGYRVLTEVDDFGISTAASPFSLNPRGGSLYLTGADPDGMLNGYQVSVPYGASELNRTQGRHTNGQGVTEFVRLTTATSGGPNADPALAPIVLNEVLFRPNGSAAEYVELRNTTAGVIQLYDDSQGAVQAWKLRGGVDFRFPTGATIPADGYALVVGGDPAAFRTAHNVPAAVPIYGPFTGDLANTGERIELTMPDVPDGAFVADVLADHVAYATTAPWPTAPGTIGAALIRQSPPTYGNDAASWSTGNVGGTPGTTNRSIDTTPPSAPTGVTATVVSAARLDLSWTAAADADSGISGYNVYRDGALLGTTTTTTFADNTISPARSYSYEIAAVNGDLLAGPRSTPAGVTIVGFTSIGNTDATHVVAVFSEPLVRATAETAARYVINGVTISSVLLGTDNRTVTLTTSEMIPGRSYTLTVNGLQSVSGNPIPSGLSGTFVFSTAGFIVRDVHAPAGSTTPNTLATAEALLALPPGHPGIGSERTAVVPVIDFRDPESGSAGHFTFNQPFPNDTPAADDYFAINARGTIQIPEGAGGPWTFGTYNDDGLRLRIDGVDVIVDPAGHGPLDVFGTVNLGAGFHTVELNYWDGIQNSVLEFFAAPGTFTSFAATNLWRLVGDVANGGLPVTTTPPDTPPDTDGWVRLGPAGSQVFQFTEQGSVTPGAPKMYQWPLLAGQTLSVEIIPQNASASVFAILGSIGEPRPICSGGPGGGTTISDFYRTLGAFAGTQGPLPGQPVVVNNFTIPADGTYAISVESSAQTDFVIRAALNAGIESESSNTTVQQVATRVIDYSTEYSPTSWSAKQALGEPDTCSYADLSTAWAPVPINGTTEHLTVGFSVPLFASGAFIRETQGNGFVRRIEALDGAGAYHEVWAGTDTSQPGTPVDFIVSFTPTTYLVYGLRVTVDTDHNQSTWEEIDAIGLLGRQSGPLFPNNSIATAAHVAVSTQPLVGTADRTAVAGTIDAVGDDFYQLQLAAGQLATVVAARQGNGTLNLALVDSAGQVLAEGATDALDADQHIARFIAAAAGTYYVRLRGTAATPYLVTMSRGADFAVEPNNDSATAADITRAGHAYGFLSEGATGATPDAGDAGTTGFTLVLNDGESFRWDIQADGSISDGTNDAYDTGQWVGDFTNSGLPGSGRLEHGGREVAIGPATVGNVSITRKIYVPSVGGFARFLEIVTNTSSSPTTYQLTIDGDLGSDGGTQVIATSSGDGVFGTDDLWVVTDDGGDQNGGVNNDPTMIHVVAGPGAAVQPSAAGLSSDSYSYSYPLTLAPGETKIVMHFASQNSNRAAALAKAPQLARVELGALSGLSATELAQIVNFALGDAVDVFSVQANAGDVLSIATTMPHVGLEPYMSGPEGPTGTNSLDPQLQLFDAAGTQLVLNDNGDADGRNATLSYTVPATGTYYVHVRAAAGAGEYTLSVTGSTATAPPLRVTSSTPGDGQPFRSDQFPTTITVNLSDGLDPATVAADDLTINGVPATAVTRVDGNTLRFTIDPAVNVGAGDYHVELAAGRLTAITGATNAAFSSTFSIDTEGPRVTAVTFNGQPLVAGKSYVPGPLEIVVTLDERLAAYSQFFPLWINENNRGGVISPIVQEFDALNGVMRLQFASLAEGRYTLRAYSQNIFDLVGNSLDGEPNPATNDGVTSGDGNPGGDYTLDFVVDYGTRSVDALWQEQGPATARVQSASITGDNTFTGDVDEYELHLAAGERLAVRATPELRQSTLTVTVRNAQSQVVATRTAAAAGGMVSLPIVASTGGRYRVSVTGDVPGEDVLVELLRNAMFEGPDNGSLTPPQPIDASHSTNGGDRFAVVGTSRPRSVGRYDVTQSTSGNVYFPNVLRFAFPAAGLPRGAANLHFVANAYLAGSFSYLNVSGEGLNLGNVFVEDGVGFGTSITDLTISQANLSRLAEDGLIELVITPSQGVFNVGNSSLSLQLTYDSGTLVWGVQPESGRIVVVDADTGTQLGGFDVAGLQASHSQIGLTTINAGASLLYVNSDANPGSVVQVHPQTGQVQATHQLPATGVDGLGFDGNRQRATIYSANMDTRPSGTYQGQWNHGRPAGNSFDPPSGFTGNNVVGFNLNGAYPDSMGTTQYFTTAAINTTGYTGTRLSFYRWLTIEGCCDDANVQISNNGTNWTTLWQVGSSDIFDQSWVQQTFDISAIADNRATVYIRWGLGPSDGSVAYGGWNIDDVEITGAATANPKVFVSRDGQDVARVENYPTTAATVVSANWATGTPTGGLAGDDTGRMFGYFTDGFIHEFDPDTDTDAFIGQPMTPPATDIEGLAFDGQWLYVSTASGLLFRLDPATGTVLSRTQVAGGALYGLAAGATWVDAAGTPTTILPQGSVWRFLDTGVDQGTAWREPTFDDAAWRSGPGRLGYSTNGQDGEVTTLSFGPNANNKYPTAYFRRRFTVTDPDAFSQLTLSLLRDDGAAVYLNGVEILRDNLVPGASYSTYANSTVSGTAEQTFFDFIISPTLLVPGENVLAVEVHQDSPNSSDLGFDLRLVAALAPRKTADVDVYTLDLTGRAGHHLDILLMGDGVSFAGATFQLLAPDGTTVLATATAPPPGTGDYDLGIRDFVVPGDGTYSLRVATTRVGRYTIAVEDRSVTSTAPQVADVVVGSSQWTTTFRDGLATAGLGNRGFSILDSADATPDRLSWTNLNQVQVRFSTDVVVTGSDLQLRGARELTYPATGFSYDSTTFTATWTFASLPDDNLIVELYDRIHAVGGEALDGDGDGSAGGSFTRRFAVLPGDLDRNGKSGLIDAVIARNSVGKSVGDAGYSAYVDVNGSGAIDNVDLTAVRRAMFRSLPTTQPAQAWGNPDLNGDGAIDSSDLLAANAALGQVGPNLPADFNYDGIVDRVDIAILLARYGQEPASPAAPAAAAVVQTHAPRRSAASGPVVDAALSTWAASNDSTPGAVGVLRTARRTVRTRGTVPSL